VIIRTGFGHVIRAISSTDKQTIKPSIFCLCRY